MGLNVGADGRACERVFVHMCVHMCVRANICGRACSAVFCCVFICFCRLGIGVKTSFFQYQFLMHWFFKGAESQRHVTEEKNMASHGMILRP